MTIDWERMRSRTWFREEQIKVTEYVEHLLAKISKLNALLEQEDRSEYLAEVDAKKLAHEHAAAMVEVDRLTKENKELRENRT